MSNLRELITELCPDGVEYKSLGDIVSIERGKRLVREQLSRRRKVSGLSKQHDTVGVSHRI